MSEKTNSPPPPFSFCFQARASVLFLGGTIDTASCLSLLQHFQEEVSTAPPSTFTRPFIFSGKAITYLDTAGAWLLLRWKKEIEKKGSVVVFQHFSSPLSGLISRVAQAFPQPLDPSVGEKHPNPLTTLILKIGSTVLEMCQKAVDFTSFLGEILLAIGDLLASRHRLRLIPFVAQLEQVGFNALPIVGLISFLMGVVLTFQGADQLRRLGAEIYTVDLVGISVLREIGILLTAVVVAGRSGSAFTAQIGSMKLNQEIDALETMGLSPLVVLVLPRVLALVVVMPFLAFFADMLGLLGGALMSSFFLKIPFPLFFHRLHETLTPWTFWVGILKAPVFGFVIGLVGCFEGFAVSGSAESLGCHTTKSVVESIFLVLVMDALFSILFTLLKI